MHRLARIHPALSCSCISALLALAACAKQRGYEPHIQGADPERGRAAIEYYECGVCHVIPGVSGPRGQVGPPLGDFRDSVYIAGKFPNSPQMLIRWIREAPSMAPESAMPAFDMSESQARDIAAYLYSAP